MTDEFTKGRFKALALVSQFLKCPSRELLLESILQRYKGRRSTLGDRSFHYYTLRLLEDVEEKIKHSREIQ